MQRLEIEKDFRVTIFECSIECYLGKQSKMLILHNGSPVGCKTAFLQIREHKEEVDRGDKFNNSIPQKLESFVVRDIGLRFQFLSRQRHDVDQSVDTYTHKIDFLIGLAFKALFLIKVLIFNNKRI
jgi:hypothetical protein